MQALKEQLLISCI